MERVFYYVVVVDCYLDCFVWVGEEEDLLVEGEVVVVVVVGVGVGVKGLGEGQLELGVVGEGGVGGLILCRQVFGQLFVSIGEK